MEKSGEQTPNREDYTGRCVPGVSSRRHSFISDWHQEGALPAPVRGIATKTQKSEHETDAVDHGGMQEM